jgi:hypothetical protein
MTTNKDLYRAFCADAPADFPIFMQDWYLDAVCEDGSWEAAVAFKGKRAVAVFPYFLKQKWGYRYVVMPKMCRLMGPYIVPEYRGNRHEPGLLNDLIEGLPRLAAFSQDFNYTAQNWLPFYWRGYRQTTRYSYVLDVRDLQQVWENIAPDYRNQKIPKAQQQVVVRSGDDLPVFMNVHNLSYQRRGLSAPLSPAFLQRLDAALQSRQARHIFFAEDLQSGAIHSVAYLIHDQHAAYYLMAGDDPALRQSGAGILTAWEAIRFTSERLQLPVFDFMGSMMHPIERVRRQFGATQKPYFRVEHARALPWKIRQLKNFF